MATRPFRSIAVKNRASWSPSAKDLADRLSSHLESEIAAQAALRPSRRRRCDDDQNPGRQ